MKAAYFFYGDDDFTATQTLRRWREQFLVKHNDAAIIRLDGESDPVEFGQELLEATGNQSLFATISLIIITQPFSLSDEKAEQVLLNSLASANLKSHVILLWQRGLPDKRRRLYRQLQDLQKKGVVAQKIFLEPKMETREAWVREFCLTYQVTISDQALSLLLTRSFGVSTWTLAERCRLLTTIAEGEITNADVQLYVPAVVSFDTFGITDALAARQSTVALKRAAPLLLARNPSVDDLAPSFGAVVWVFRTMLQMKHGDSASINPNVVRKLHPFISRWESDQLSDILVRAAELDILVKTGKTEFQWALEELIMRA